MGYRTKVQVIKRVKSKQFYVCFPSALAQAMDFQPSEVVEWVVTRKGELLLRRVDDEERD
jgi:hypothetical protein